MKNKIIPVLEKPKKLFKGIRPNRVLIPNNLFVKLYKDNTLRLRTVGAISLTEKQIKGIRTNLKILMGKNTASIRIPLLADHPVSKKPLEIRMGKGKGAIHHNVVKVNPGNILVEMKLNKPDKYSRAVSGLLVLQKKLPVKTTIEIL